MSFLSINQQINSKLLVGKMSAFAKKEAHIIQKLTGIKTTQYQKIAEEVKNDILLSDHKSLETTRKKLNENRKKLTQKNTPANNRKAANIDIILSVMDGKNNTNASSINTTGSKKNKGSHPAATKKAKKASPKAKKAAQSQKAKKASKSKSAEKVKLTNVAGDGNCFYRALWGAAHNHPEGDLTQTIYKLFTGANANGPIAEEPFIAAIRCATATKIKDGIYDTINDAAKADIRANTSFVTEAGRQKALNTQLSFFEDMRQSAFSKPDERFLFENWLQESSREIQQEFTLRKFKAKYKTAADAAKFYQDLAKVVGTNMVYASVSDVDVVKFILKQNHIVIHPDTEKPKEFYPSKDGNKHLWLKKRGDHYMFWHLL
jgi:hypothetical protein